MPLTFEQFIFDARPPALEIFRKRLEERYALPIVAHENDEPAAYDARQISQGELWPAEAPEAKLRWHVGRTIL